MAYLNINAKDVFGITANGNPKMRNGVNVVITDAQKYVNGKDANGNDKINYSVTLMKRNDVFDMSKPWQADPRPYLITRDYGDIAYTPQSAGAQAITFSKKMRDGSVVQLPAFKPTHTFNISSKNQLNLINSILPDGKTIEDFADKCQEYRLNNNYRSPENDADFQRENALCFRAPLVMSQSATVWDRNSKLKILSVTPEGSNMTVDLTKSNKRNPSEAYRQLTGEKLPKNATLEVQYKENKGDQAPSSAPFKITVNDFNKSEGIKLNFPTNAMLKANALKVKNPAGLDSQARALSEKYETKIKPYFMKAAKGSESFDLETHKINTLYSALMCKHFGKEVYDVENPENQRVAGMKYVEGDPFYVDYETFKDKIYPQIARYETESEANNPLKAERLAKTEAYVLQNGGSRIGLPQIYQIARDDKTQEQSRQAMWLIANEIGVPESDMGNITDNGVKWETMRVTADQLRRFRQTPNAQALEDAKTAIEAAYSDEESYDDPSYEAELLRNEIYLDSIDEEDFVDIDGDQDEVEF